MNVSLTPALESFVKEKVESGLYTSASEVVREALRLLADHEMQRELQRHVRVGLDEASRGEVVDGPSTIRELREAIRKRHSPERE